MRPWLRWLLIVTVLTSVGVLLWPETVTQAVSRTEASLTTIGTSSATMDGAPTTQSSPPPSLPQHLAVLSLAKSTFDPFAGVQPPPPPPPSVPAPAAVEKAPPPLPPAAPPFNYRYLGRMVDPSGKPFVYLGRTNGDDSAVIAVGVGSRLDEGYVVETIRNDGIRLVYPPLDTHVVIDIRADAAP